MCEPWVHTNKGYSIVKIICDNARERYIFPNILENDSAILPFFLLQYLFQLDILENNWK